MSATVTIAPFHAAWPSKIAIWPDSKVDLLFYGLPGQSYRIQRSTDLISWIKVETRTPGVDGILAFADCAAPPGQALSRTGTRAR